MPAKKEMRKLDRGCDPIYCTRDPAPGVTNEELHRLYREGDESARQKLWVRNLPFCIRMASKRVRTCRETLDEVLSDAYTGLADAIERYRPESGAKFISAASYSIRVAIVRGRHKRLNLVKLPYGQLYSRCLSKTDWGKAKHRRMLEKAEIAKRPYRSLSEPSGRNEVARSDFMEEVIDSGLDVSKVMDDDVPFTRLDAQYAVLAMGIKDIVVDPDAGRNGDGPLDPYHGQYRLIDYNGTEGRAIRARKGVFREQEMERKKPRPVHD